MNEEHASDLEKILALIELHHAARGQTGHEAQGAQRTLERIEALVRKQLLDRGTTNARHK